MIGSHAFLVDLKSHADNNDVFKFSRYCVIAKVISAYLTLKMKFKEIGNLADYWK